MNVSEMKRLVAYNFKDLLQVHNSSVATCRILTDLSSAVHSPGVQRPVTRSPQHSSTRPPFPSLPLVLPSQAVHTDKTLKIMDNVTKSLGNTICAFEANACLVFRTRELKCEVQGHQCHKVHSQSQHEGTSTSVAVSTQRPKTLNLWTYKLHALGDYMASIRMFGTTDSYLTQPVSIW